MVATNFLKKWGIQITYANDGKEALEEIKSKEFDLVLMDLQMPEMDGYEATQKIRQMGDPYFRTVPILALTASAMSGTQGKVEQIGMNDYIMKPFNPEDLREKIGKYSKAGSPEENKRSKSSVIVSDLYMEGDADFKRELAGHLIKNIQEMKEALHKTLKTGDVEIYSKACHKIKTTLSLLGDTEYALSKG